MKALKFKDYLVPKVLDGSKVITWRLFDDKNLQVGDKLLFVNSDSGKEFAKAEITGVREKKLGEITETDFEEGHEKYKSQGRYARALPRLLRRRGWFKFGYKNCKI